MSVPLARSWPSQAAPSCRVALLRGKQPLSPLYIQRVSGAGVPACVRFLGLPLCPIWPPSAPAALSARVAGEEAEDGHNARIISVFAEGGLTIRL